MNTASLQDYLPSRNLHVAETLPERCRTPILEAIWSYGLAVHHPHQASRYLLTFNRHLQVAIESTTRVQVMEALSARHIDEQSLYQLKQHGRRSEARFYWESLHRLPNSVRSADLAVTEAFLRSVDLTWEDIDVSEDDIESLLHGDA